MKNLLRNIVMWTGDEAIRSFLGMLEENSSARILDCGCSDGSFTKAVAAKIGTKDIYGIELVGERAQFAVDSGVKVLMADLNKTLPFKDESFDVVLASEVIEHLHGTDTFLSEIRRILKHGGYAVLATPNLASFHNLAFLFLGLQPPTACVSDELKVSLNLSPWQESSPTGAQYPAHAHLRVFTGNALKRLLQHHGFIVERTVNTGWYPFAGRFARFMVRVDGKHSAHLTVKIRKAKHSPEIKPSVV